MVAPEDVLIAGAGQGFFQRVDKFLNEFIEQLRHHARPPVGGIVDVGDKREVVAPALVPGLLGQFQWA